MSSQGVCYVKNRTEGDKDKGNLHSEPLHVTASQHADASMPHLRLVLIHLYTFVPPSAALFLLLRCRYGIFGSSSP